MKLKKSICLLLAVVMVLPMCACTSDYPVMDRELNIAEFISSCFDGSGYNIDVGDSATIIVDGVADRLTIDLEQSSGTITRIQQAVRNAVLSEDGLTGTWTGAVNITPVLGEVFSDLEGLDLESYIGQVMVTAEVTFTNSGIYTVHFDSAELDSSYNSILDHAVDATRAYLSSLSSGVAKIVVNALDDSILEQILKYVVDLEITMLKNGASGNYSAKNGVITFTGEDGGKCSFNMSGELLTLSDGTMTGITGLIAQDSRTFRKA